MHKPIKQEPLKALKISEENGFDLSTSQISSSREMDDPINKAGILDSPGNWKLPLSKRLISEAESNKKNTPKRHNRTKTVPCKANGKNVKCISKVGVKIAEPPASQKKKKECDYCKKLNCQELIYKILYKKYEETTQITYNVNIINDIIVNANTHIVALFKDYLIQDDPGEFVKSYYDLNKVSSKLTEVTQNVNRKLIPNYICLEEKKYFLKNMQRKQKVLITKNKTNNNNRKSNKKEYNNLLAKEHKMFSKGFYEDAEDSKLNMLELVEKYMIKDSLSQINQTNCQNIEATFCNPSKPVVIEQKSNATKPPPKRPLKISINSKITRVNNYMSPTTNKVPLQKVDAIKKLTSNAHHQSQEELKKDTKASIGSTITLNSPTIQSGRMSSVGNYCPTNLTKRDNKTSQATYSKKPSPQVVKKQVIVQNIAPQTCRATEEIKYNCVANKRTVPPAGNSAPSTRAATVKNRVIATAGAKKMSNPRQLPKRKNDKEEIKKSNTRQPSVKKDDRQTIFSTTHKDNLLTNIHNLLTPNSMDARSNQALCKSKSTFQSPISQGTHKQSFPPKKVEPPKCRAGTALGSISKTSKVVVQGKKTITITKGKKK